MFKFLNDTEWNENELQKWKSDIFFIWLKFN